MFVVETGDRKANAVLFLHPLGLDHGYWGTQQATLSDCLVLAPDLPGFGRSRLEPSGLSNATKACAELIGGRAGSAVVVGISYGGYVAVLLASAYPALVRGLAISGVRRDVPRSLAHLQAMLFRGMRKASLARGESASASALTTEKRNLIAASQELGSVDLRPILPRIAAPTIIFAPERDRFVRTEVRHVAELLPDARVMPITGAGHLWADAQPTVLTRAVRDLFASSSQPPA
jgi:pimeloyl-ACP methyl ester carboxylesterase